MCSSSSRQGCFSIVVWCTWFCSDCRRVSRFQHSFHSGSHHKIDQALRIWTHLNFLCDRWEYRGQGTQIGPIEKGFISKEDSSFATQSGRAAFCPPVDTTQSLHISRFRAGLLCSMKELWDEFKEYLGKIILQPGRECCPGRCVLTAQCRRTSVLCSFGCRPNGQMADETCFKTHKTLNPKT